jgi:hypothetical protein
MGSERAELSAEDRELLDRLASRVVELRMEVPAILAIETGKPLSLLASQAMVFLEPLVLSVFNLTGYRRIALLMERREALEALVRSIETRAEAARAAARAARGAPAARRDGTGPGR